MSSTLCNSGQDSNQRRFIGRHAIVDYSPGPAFHSYVRSPSASSARHPHHNGSSLIPLALVKRQSPQANHRNRPAAGWTTPLRRREHTTNEMDRPAAEISVKRRRFHRCYRQPSVWDKRPLCPLRIPSLPSPPSSDPVEANDSAKTTGNCQRHRVAFVDETEFRHRFPRGYRADVRPSATLKSMRPNPTR